MSQFAEKSILAKLLATENVHVEHQKVSTAYFDLQNRTVVLPIFKKMSADLYDLLIGHEVGHALETPAEGWHNAICDKGAGFKSFLNVIEDSRIERLMKNRYPGLRRSFYNGYKELFEQNFFGVDGMDVNKLKFIDRINLHAKVGPFLGIQFSSEEQAIVDRLDTLETWEDVVALATELYGRAETSTEEYDFDQFLDQFQMDSIADDGDGEFDPTAEPDQTEENGDEAGPGQPDDADEESDDAQSDGDSSDDADEESDDAQSDGDSSDETGEEETDDAQSSSQQNGAGGDIQSEPTSFTDDNFRENEDSLIDQSSRETFYTKLPVFDPSDYVVSVNAVEKMLQFSAGREDETVDQVKSELYADFLAKNRKYLSAMVQDFERKKTAQSLMRAQTSKTGRINMDKVWAYKVTEDLFLQNTVVPNGQNHGMIMYLDMSGSMSTNMSGTMEQLVLLASFCQKVRIPFEVYGFVTNSGVPDEYLYSIQQRNDESDPKNLKICNSGFRLLQLVTTGVSGSKFKAQMINLLALGKTYDRSYYRLYLTGTAVSAFNLGTTPLEETLMIGRFIAEDFKARNRVEVLSSVFLTDGDGDANFNTVSRATPYRQNLAITDSKSRRTFAAEYDGQNYRSRSFCNALLQLYKATTGSRMINFYLLDSYSLKNFLYRSNLTDDEIREARKSFRKDGASILQNTNGFDNQFLIKSGNALKTVQDTFEATANDKRTLIKEFKSFQNKKSMNRVVLTKMIEAVA